MHSPLIAFDFSMAKPAMAALFNNKLYMYVWPMNIDSKTVDILENADIVVNNRQLPEISTKKIDENTLICEHVNRASSLADMIVSDIKTLLAENSCEGYMPVIANEGLAFSASGNVMLDLSGYKYILMYRLISEGFTDLRTYAPLTIKSTAHCSKKGMKKEDMIQKLKDEPDVHWFIHLLKTDESLLKKKTAFVKCVDDLTDAYWCLKTIIKKENIKCILSDD